VRVKHAFVYALLDFYYQSSKLVHRWIKVHLVLIIAMAGGRFFSRRFVPHSLRKNFCLAFKKHVVVGCQADARAHNVHQAAALGEQCL
jgi:hypothetical protein